jgi:drug/metabolite transporter (DMT)-like permease
MWMVSPLTQRRIEWLGYGACATAGCLWGTGFYFGRIALNEMSVESMVLYRFAFACLGLLPILWRSWFRDRVRLTRGEWGTLLLSAFLGIPLQFLIQFHGLALTTVSHASLMVGTLPVLIALSAVLFARERLDFVGWLALVGSTCGVGLIVLGGKSLAGASSLEGDLTIGVSLVISVAWIMLNKKLMGRHSPVVVTTYCILAGAAMLGIWVLAPWVSGHAAAPPFASVSLKAWMALAASGFFCTAATTLLWNWGIHHVPTSRAAVFLNLEPAVGSWMGVQLLGEKMGPYAWFGGGLILAAAMVLTMRGESKEPEMILE